jgi:hypothetical protein
MDYKAQLVGITVRGGELENLYEKSLLIFKTRLGNLQPLLYGEITRTVVVS